MCFFVCVVCDDVGCPDVNPWMTAVKVTGPVGNGIVQNCVKTTGKTVAVCCCCACFTTTWLAPPFVHVLSHFLVLQSGLDTALDGAGDEDDEANLLARCCRSVAVSGLSGCRHVMVPCA